MAKKHIEVEIEGANEMKQVEAMKKANFFKKVGHGVKKAAKATVDFVDEHPYVVLCALTGGLYTVLAANSIAESKKSKTVKYHVEWGEGETPLGGFDFDKTV